MRKLNFVVPTLAALLALPALAGAQDGQLQSVAAAARVDARDSQQLYTGHLSGAQEVPTVLTDAGGVFRIDFSGNLDHANYSLSVFGGQGITQAHLHCGAAGTNGPVVAFLLPLDVNGVDVDGPVARGTLTNDDIIPQDPPNEVCGVTINNLASLLAAIRQDRVYVNVHSTAHPGGEIRDQLFGNGDAPR